MERDQGNNRGFGVYTVIEIGPDDVVRGLIEEDRWKRGKVR